jgi:hypothetical protein
LVPIMTCENISSIPSQFIGRTAAIAFREAEQPRAVLVAGNVDGAVGVVQAGEGQPGEAREVSGAVRLRFGNLAP